MKAVAYSEYGPPDVLHINEIPKPVPKDNEILIRIHATPVNYGDIAARNFKNIPARDFNMPMPLWFLARIAFGCSKPKNPILGSEFAGEIEAVGQAVKKFNKGDALFGYTGLKMGAYAEYLCMPEDGAVAIKPANLSYEQASALPYGAIMAFSLLRKAHIQPGQKVLINGASGGIGSIALQLAGHFGAEVSGVCGTPRLEYIKALGAAKAIDYTVEDFTRNGEKYDLIFDILGRSSFAQCQRSLTPNGRYLLASFKTKQLVQMLMTSVTGGRKVICALASERTEDLELIRELAEDEKIKSIIDRSFPLERAAEAHRYAESGQKRGNVVIVI